MSAAVAFLTGCGGQHSRPVDPVLARWRASPRQSRQSRSRRSESRYVPTSREAEPIPVLKPLPAKPAPAPAKLAPRPRPKPPAAKPKRDPVRRVRSSHHDTWPAVDVAAALRALDRAGEVGTGHHIWAYEKMFTTAIPREDQDPVLPDAHERSDPASLVDELRDDDETGNAHDAWEKLVRIGRPAARPLVRALDSDDTQHRVLAAAALGRIGGDDVIEALVTQFGDDDIKHNAQAAYMALVATGDEAIPALERATASQDQQEARYARCLLSVLGSRARGSSQRVRASASRRRDDDARGKRAAEAPVRLTRGKLEVVTGKRRMRDVLYELGSRTVNLTNFLLPEHVHDAKRSPDGRFAYVWHCHQPPRQVTVYALPEGRPLTSFEPGYGGALRWTPRNQILHRWSAGANVMGIRVYDTQSTVVLEDSASGVSVSPGTRYLATYPTDFAARSGVVVRDLATLEITHRSTKRDDVRTVVDATWHGDGVLAVTYLDSAGEKRAAKIALGNRAAK